MQFLETLQLKLPDNKISDLGSASLLLALNKLMKLKNVFFDISVNNIGKYEVESFLCTT